MLVSARLKSIDMLNPEIFWGGGTVERETSPRTPPHWRLWVCSLEISGMAVSVYLVDRRDYTSFCSIKPNTHRRRRRYCQVASLCRHLSAQEIVNWVTTADGCVHTNDTTKLSPTSCEFVFTPLTPTRQNSFVASASAVCIGHYIASYDCFNVCVETGLAGWLELRAFLSTGQRSCW